MGMLALVATQHHFHQLAAWCIIGGMVWDALDGALARLWRVSSDFGKEMDALADLVTFGVAPSFLLYQQIVGVTSIYILPTLILFPVCGALRLARFNTTPPASGGHFTGMPITAAGGVLALCSLSWMWITSYGAVALALLLSWLMVSHIPYPGLKSVPLLTTPLGICLGVGVVTLFFILWRAWLFIPLLLYTLVAPFICKMFSS
ncbi:MAG: CDP-diacylglycerol--serine O-phosphatidyltransferase [Symbiobacteriaceae bacterium]|nr:CDP-diacylglycerol--serine O-phosphatidyltransferase [Symbiobacteriaceae bacterium]